MQFRLNTFLAMMSFLTTTALAIAIGTRDTATTEARGCFDGGEKWTDLGTSDQIYAALDDNVCNIDAGGWALGAKLDLCVLVDKTSDYYTDNSFHFAWTITKIPNGQELGNLSHDVCVSFAQQVINSCPYGGVFNLLAGPGADGGDKIGAAITADPQKGPNCGGKF